MNENNTHNAPPTPGGSPFGLLKVVGIAVLAIAVLAAWWVKSNIYASEFTPTRLIPWEQRILDSKLSRMQGPVQREGDLAGLRPPAERLPLDPEPYTEEDAKREISLTERELNGLIAGTPEAASRVAFDLSENLVSVKLVVPMDEEIPLLGGKTLRLNMGIILGYEHEQPVVALKGISLGGIPLPKAWLGYLKNRNLVEEFHSGGGFWQLFAEGVRDIRVREGHIRIRLKE
jgi:hypothetical protein